MNNNDKINAMDSLKIWAVERQLYELASSARTIEKLLLKEITSDYIRVVKDIEYLSDEQKQFIFSCDLFKHLLNKEYLRDLKITLIQNNGSS
jgi:hypothetical protein